MACPNYQLPGLTISVVANSTVIYQKGFGYVDLAHTQEVNEKTLFGIGSCTKSFTAVLAAIGRDQGLIDFDAPIDATYHPDFELADPLAAPRFNLRDLLAHRTGVG
jgi:CubicO group peptidase (beta-lactamase class C family)